MSPTTSRAFQVAAGELPMSDEPEYLETEPVPRPAPPPAARDAGSPANVRRAWMAAIAADALQWGLFPLFAWGGLSPLNTGLDLAVGFLMMRWMGWHLAFLPAFITELVPVANFVPSWTLAMWIVTRMRRSES
jgi:hypothetical protein